MTSEQDHLVADLHRQRDDLQAERDDILGKIMQLRQELAEGQAMCKELDDRRSKLDGEIEAHQDMIASKTAEKEREEVRKHATSLSIVVMTVSLATVSAEAKVVA